MSRWSYRQSPDYRTLYSNLSDQDGGAIVTQLTQMNIPYRFADNGGALEYRQIKCTSFACVSPSRGCQKAARLGLNCWIGKFGISQFSEQVNYQRALEGELAARLKP